jgi:threonine dehydratase
VVDRWELLDEGEIKAALLQLLTSARKLVEGAAATAMAACLRDAAAGRLVDKVVVVVICGGNISVEKLKSVLC